MIIFLICLDNGKEIKINELDTLKEEKIKYLIFNLIITQNSFEDLIYGLIIQII